MECPKCGVKLMADERQKQDLIKVRCMKCGSEFTLKKGMIKQKKVKKITKTYKKGVTITKGGAASAGISQAHSRILKQHEMIQRQVAEVQKINRKIRKNKGL